MAAEVESPKMEMPEEKEESRISTVIREAKESRGKEDRTYKSILALSSEHVRLELIRKLGEGPATLQRPTAGQNEVEALFAGLETKGVKMRGVNTYITQCRVLSPGAGGKGIDSFLKVLTPVPTFAMPGSATEEVKKDSALARFVAWFLGSKGSSEEKK